MMKALTEKVGDSSGSHSHYTAAGAAAERIVSDPGQYGETTTALALTKSNDAGSPNRTGMWGAKFLQLSEARTSVALVRCSVVWCAVCVVLFCARAVLCCGVMHCVVERGCCAEMHGAACAVLGCESAAWKTYVVRGVRITCPLEWVSLLTDQF